MFDLFQGWCFLLPCRGSNPGVFAGQIEILGINILYTRLVAWLIGQPLKESFQLGKGRMQGRLAQLLPGLLSFLIG